MNRRDGLENQLGLKRRRRTAMALRAITATDQLNAAGYAILPGVFPGAAVERARRQIAEALDRTYARDSVLSGREGLAYGARNLLRLWPDVVGLICVPKF